MRAPEEQWPKDPLHDGYEKRPLQSSDDVCLSPARWIVLEPAVARGFSFRVEDHEGDGVHRTTRLQSTAKQDGVAAQIPLVEELSKRTRRISLGQRTSGCGQ